MEKRKVVLIEGDGIGPEIMEAVVHVLEQAGAQIEWQQEDAGVSAIEKHGEALPEKTLNAIREAKVALKGPIGTPIGQDAAAGKEFKSVNVAIRKALDLYANYRPIKNFDGVESRYDNVDMNFIRENTEGMYSGLEHEIVPGVITSLKVATETALTRIAEFAFLTAKREGRKKVTGVHKANIMKMADGLALRCYRSVAEKYPEIEYEERIIDAAAMALVLDPTKFDVILTQNLYGDILSDLGAGLIGGLGLAPSANFGKTMAVFEAVHGSAPDIAGKGIANPTALLLSAKEMLRYIDQHEPADRISKAVKIALKEGKNLTADLRGKASTMEYAREIVSLLN